MIYLESLKYSLKKNRIRKRSVQFGGGGGSSGSLHHGYRFKRQMNGKSLMVVLMRDVLSENVGYSFILKHTYLNRKADARFGRNTDKQPGHILK